MSIAIVIVNEDLQTIVNGSELIESIDSNNDFYTLRNIAKQMKLTLISTIDEAGLTIINELQQDTLQEEINLLRNTMANQKILDTLQKALDLVRQQGPQYIKFIGD